MLGQGTYRPIACIPEFGVEHVVNAERRLEGDWLVRLIRDKEYLCTHRRAVVEEYILRIAHIAVGREPYLGKDLLKRVTIEYLTLTILVHASLVVAVAP